MFDHFSTEQWQVIIGVVSLVIVIVAPVLTVAIKTMKYIIRVEKHTSASAASTEAIASSLETLKEDNEEDHKTIHGRIDSEREKNEQRFESVDKKTGEHGEKLVKHGVHIETLLNKGCP